MKRFMLLLAFASIATSGANAQSISLELDAQNGSAPISLDTEFTSEEISGFLRRASEIRVKSVNFDGGPSDVRLVQPLSEFARFGDRDELFAEDNRLEFRHARFSSLDRTFIFEAPITNAFVALVAGRSIEGCDRTPFQQGTLLVRSSRMVVVETNDGANHLIAVKERRPELPLTIDEDGLFTRQLGRLSCREPTR